MIQPNELRIGNWVEWEFKNKSRKIEVESVWAGGINVQGGYGGSIEPEYDYRTLYPIPLTPEILEKCGFKNREMNIDIWEKGINVLRYPLEPNEYYFCIPDKSTLSIINESKFSFLHQLQNLYFALTNEELIYKP